MKWSEVNKGNDNIHYDHVTLDTPLGEFVITWKSWKENPSYDLELEDKWIGVDYDLDQSKSRAKQYLLEKQEELHKFINS